MQGTYIEANQANFSRGRAGKRVEFIVLHTMDGFMNGTISWFKNPDSKVTTHFLVGVDGTIVQMVPRADTAWHAGNLDMNQRAIGIEAEDLRKPNEPRTPQQTRAIAELVAELAKEYNIPLDETHILRHSEVNPKKPNCPGSLDRGLVISLARDINNTNVPTPPPAPTPNLYPATRNVTVVPDKGLNFRSAPDATQKNIVRILAKGNSFTVEGYVVGQLIDGNNVWWKVKDKNEYAWSGATNFVPTIQQPAAPTPATPEPQIPITPPPAPEGLPMENPEVLKLRIEALETELKRVNTNFSETNAFVETLKKDLKDAQTKLAAFGDQNFETVKNANELLNDQYQELLRKNQELKTQRDDAYVQAFKGWTLTEVPTGAKGSAIVLSLIARLFKFDSRKRYVVGWKPGASLYRVDEKTPAIEAEKATGEVLQAAA